MHRPFEPGSPPEAIPAHLGELPAELFDDALWRAHELVERYAVDLTIEIVGRLGLAPSLAAPRSPAELLELHGWSAGFEPALGSLLARLAQDGLVDVLDENGAVRYVAGAALPPSDRAELRRHAERLETGVGASLDLLDAAAELYPAVADGEADGERELLAPARIPLWLRYFSEENRPYALANRIAAVAATNRLPSGRRFRLLEVGAGAGSAALALLEELERRGRLDDVELYRLTEPHPFFRRRAERAIRDRYPALPLETGSLDVDEPAPPTVGPTAADLVLGVNVLHVADRLPEALARLRGRLAPGGTLVLGECLPARPGQAVAADLVFRLFAGFTGVTTDPELRPRPGFLVPAEWIRLLSAAGYGRVEVVPDLLRLHEIHPRIVTGAVCARSVL